jgi:hypothetical protein
MLSNCGVFNSPKRQIYFIQISAQGSNKWLNKKGNKAPNMYNTLPLFFLFNHFLDAREEIFVDFFGKIEDTKFSF